MSSYKNPAIIPPFQSRVALVENLWKPPKSTEFSSLLSAPPHYVRYALNSLLDAKQR